MEIMKMPALNIYPLNSSASRDSGVKTSAEEARFCCRSSASRTRCSLCSAAGDMRDVGGCLPEEDAAAAASPAADATGNMAVLMRPHQPPAEADTPSEVAGLEETGGAPSEAAGVSAPLDPKQRKAHGPECAGEKPRARIQDETRSI